MVYTFFQSGNQRKYSHRAVRNDSGRKHSAAFRIWNKSFEVITHWIKYAFLQFYEMDSFYIYVESGNYKV